MPIYRIAMLALFAAGLGLTNELQAQTLLRWQLKPGDELAVTVEQQTTSQVAFSGKSATTKIDLAMELVWKVAAADDKEITLQQSLRRLKFKLDSPKAGLVEYDTDQKAKPTGSAREVAEAIQPLRDAEVTITMSGRGEVLAAKPSNAAAEALFSEEKSSVGETSFSKTTLQKLLKQPLVVLPEKPVAMGDFWSTSSDVSAALGAMRQTTSYRLAGEIEQEGQKLLKIESSGKLEPAGEAAPAATPKLTLKSHEQSGTLLYSADLNRIVQAEQTQKLVTERPYRETSIVVTLNSTQKTTVQSN